MTSSGFDQYAEAHFRPPDSSLHPERLPPTRGVAGSSFRSLPNIRYCSPPWRSGQCLSPDVAGQPLSPATRRCLGEPLPHQQADRPRAHLKAIPEGTFGPKTTCGINLPFGRLSPTLGQVAHVLLTRPPLENQLASYSVFSFDLHVLSTPPAFILSQNQTLRINAILRWTF